MIPAHERFYGSMPGQVRPPPFVSLEPKPLATMPLQVTTLLNPSAKGMYMNHAEDPRMGAFKGWGINLAK